MQSSLEPPNSSVGKAIILIYKAQKILISLHRNPDGDSVGSCLAMYEYLTSLGKKITFISPSKISDNFDFLPNIKKVKIVDFLNLKDEKFDLFICLDAGGLYQLVDNQQLPEYCEKIWPIINIDHHKTNKNYGAVNIVDEKSSSTSELLYDLLQRWGIEIDKALALPLLTGIVSDTGGFRYSNTRQKTLETASILMSCGVDLYTIMFNIFRRNDLKALNYWGLVLNKLTINKKDKYVSVALSYKDEDRENLEVSESYREQAASHFLAVVEGTDFGYILEEEKKGLIRGSLRARTDFDVSQIAVALGGGGHAGSSGFTIKNMSLEEAQKKVEEVIGQIREDKNKS
ncbi:MAG: bifunctional oligoribonuclease/PAP phosphatase NrnA [bacterium]|nr:bifunctional oligoribonuclease/PAP phosphatase NrnA [bacterium]